MYTFGGWGRAENLRNVVVAGYSVCVKFNGLFSAAADAVAAAESFRMLCGFRDSPPCVGICVCASVPEHRDDNANFSSNTKKTTQREHTHKQLT